LGGGKEVARPVYMMLTTLTDTERKALQDNSEIWVPYILHNVFV
jgi:hypothetical protein